MSQFVSFVINWQEIVILQIKNDKRMEKGIRARRVRGK